MNEIHYFESICIGNLSKQAITKMKMDPINGYIALRRKADLLFASTAQYHDDLPQCRAGCCNCCTLSSILPIEAFALARAIRALAPAVQTIITSQAKQTDLPHCPLLADSLCSVYPSRPIICRTHGAPLAYLDYFTQTIEISACPVKYPADISFDTESLLFMDELNSELQELNRQFLPRQTGKPQRLKLTEIVHEFKRLCSRSC